jgi:hypothetical protein
VRATILAIMLALLVGAAVADAEPASELAIAIRYLQATGESHSHIFLYRADGKLLRQLTREDSGQDIDPIFSADGESIVFTRTRTRASPEFWLVSPRGENMRRLDAAPDWYTSAKTPPFFEWPDAKADAEEYGARLQQFRSPDGAYELVLREMKGEEADTLNEPGHGKHYLLRDLEKGDQVEFGSLPGFEGAVEQLQLRGSDQRFFIAPPLRLAFFGVHLNSTDGDTDYALDLPGRRFVRLSPNWAAPVPLPDEPAFLTITSNRYVPIAGSSKTANCTYLELWDAELHKVRFARERAAAICYGASMYRPGKTPAVISIRRDVE